MGLTAALAGSAILLAGSRLEHLAPSWPLILADYGVTIVLHLGLAFAAVAAAFAGLTRAAAARAIPSSPARSEGTPRATGSEGKRLPGSSALGDSIPIRHPLGLRGPGSCRPAEIHNTTTHLFSHVIEIIPKVGYA